MIQCVRLDVITRKFESGLITSVSVCYVILSNLTIILWCTRKKKVSQKREVIGNIENRISHGYVI